jgi:hypothetical protein
MVKKNPDLKKIMEDLGIKKMIAISAAAEAARFKETNPNATEEQIIKHVTENVEEIIRKVDDPF